MTHFTRHTLGILLATTVLVAASCGLGSKSATTTTTAPKGTKTGAAKPIDIDAVIKASRKEPKLVIYGSPTAQQWKPVLDAFAKAYPWIKVEAFDTGGTEGFQRYLSEAATGSATADVIVASDGPGWLDVVKRGEIVDYVDPQLASLPPYAVAAPGVFTMSTDPLVALFNTRALPLDKQPTTLAELAKMAPSLDGKIGTIEVQNGQAGLGTFGYIDKRGEAGWKVLEQLGPHTKAESGTGSLLAKVTSGEYVASFFASGAVRELVDTTDAGKTLNYRYFKDAAVLPSRGIGVTRAAKSPNAAKVLINFLLSKEGQTAACGGGFTPYRKDVTCKESLSAIQDKVGKDNAIVIGYPPAVVTGRDQLRARWNKAFGR